MRFLLDENLEHEVYHRLCNYGHDIVHVEVSDTLRKGMSDPELAAVSLNEIRVLVTYDDDFREISEDDFHAVLFLPDQTAQARTIADVLHEVSNYYSTEQVRGFQTVGKSWLE